MTELATLARPYAEASFKRAKETASTQQWSEALAFVAQVLHDGQLQGFLYNPRLGQERISQLLVDIVKDHVGVEVQNLLRLLVRNGKLSIVPELIKQFEQNKADDEGYVDVAITSAYPLNKTEQSRYVSMLEKRLQKKVHAQVTVDASLIGGVIAKAGDKVIDSSIRGQLHQLAKRL
jgi:F-type H+-transporting ATPase subunit delta